MWHSDIITHVVRYCLSQGNHPPPPFSWNDSKKILYHRACLRNIILLVSLITSWSCLLLNESLQVTIFCLVFNYVSEWPVCLCCLVSSLGLHCFFGHLPSIFLVTCLLQHNSMWRIIFIPSITPIVFLIVGLSTISIRVMACSDPSNWLCMTFVFWFCLCFSFAIEKENNCSKLFFLHSQLGLIKYYT